MTEPAKNSVFPYGNVHERFTPEFIDYAERWPKVAAAWISFFIREARRDQKITQAELASLLGLGMSAVSNIESGNAFANMERTLSILYILHIPAAAVFQAAEMQMQLHDLDFSSLNTPRREIHFEKPESAQIVQFED